MNEQIEAEILSYREFRKRETFRAWEQRRRALESQPDGRRAERIREALRRLGAAPFGTAPPR